MNERERIVDFIRIRVTWLEESNPVAADILRDLAVEIERLPKSKPAKKKYRYVLDFGDDQPVMKLKDLTLALECFTVRQKVDRRARLYRKREGGTLECLDPAIGSWFEDDPAYVAVKVQEALR